MIKSALLIFVLQPVLLFAGEFQYKNYPGCEDLKRVYELTEMAALVDDSGDTELSDAVSQLKETRRALCSLITPAQGATVYYSNGKTATSYAQTSGATWYYPNGKTITSYAGSSGATWYYPNGKTITSYMGTTGATWYYLNGKTVTSYFGTKGATWYYPNGKTITSYAGTKGATWYYSNGQTITSYMGTAGATWYYSTGKTMTSSGPEIEEAELLEVPRIIVDLLGQ